MIQLRQEAINQHGEVVLTMRGMGMYKCRPR